MARRLSSDADNPTTPDPVSTSTPVDQSTASGPSDVARTDEPAPETPETPDATPPSEDLDEDLITSEERASLANNPAGLEKALRRGFTQKTQKMAAMRKQVEPYLPIIQALQDDPAAAVRALAEQVGLKVEAAIQDPKAEPTDLETLARQSLHESLGEEYEDLADRLAPGFLKVLKAGIAEATKPVMERQERLDAESSVREAQKELTAFDTAVPGWRKYEPQMNQLATRLKPSPGMETAEYLRILYNHCAADEAVARETKRTVDKITQNAASSRREAAPVHSDQVSLKPPTPLTFAQAAAMARNGQRVER